MYTPDLIACFESAPVEAFWLRYHLWEEYLPPMYGQDPDPDFDRERDMQSTQALNGCW